MAISYNNFNTDSTIYSIDFNGGDASPQEEYILVNLDNNTLDEDSIISSETVFDRLMVPFEEVIQVIEMNRKVHHREAFSFPQFVRLLVYYFVMGIESGRLLITKRKTSSKDLNLFPIKRSTFFDAFNRFQASLFYSLFTTLVTTITFISIPELEMLGQLICVDGSIFPTIISMGWAEYKENKNALKLHLCFELNRMIPVQLLITSANFSEREALREMLEAGVTYIADRGYPQEASHCLLYSFKRN